MNQIVVVGAGPSGLAAAYRLQQAGKDVVVLEAGERPGSKLASGERDGFVVDRGAFFLASTYTRVLGLAAELGLRAEDGGTVFAGVRGGRLERLDIGNPVRGFRETGLLTGRGKAAAAKLVSEALRARRDLGQYDTENLGAWAARAQHPEVAEYLIDPLIRSMYATEIDEISRVELLGILALFAGAKLVAFRGGMAAYGTALAGALDVRYGARVAEVRQTATGAVVAWADADGRHSEEVDGAVVALAARDAVAVRSDLDDWRAHYLRRVPAGPIALVNVALSRPVLETDATYAMIGRSEHPDLSGIVLNRNKAAGRVPAGKDLLTLCPTTQWSARQWDRDDADVAAAAIALAEPLVPGLGAHVEFTEVNRWRQQYPPVGHYAALGEFKRRTAAADRTVQLCGEYLAAPTLESSTASGEAAAAALLTR